MQSTSFSSAWRPSSRESTSSAPLARSKRSNLSQEMLHMIPVGTPVRWTPPVRHTSMLSAQPPPLLLAGQAGIYLTVSEFDDEDETLPQGISRMAVRHCSFAIRHDFNVNEFAIHYLHRLRDRGDRLTLYKVKKCPNPRHAEPGLLAMEFLGYFPPQQLHVMETLLQRVENHLNMSRTACHSQLWMRLSLKQMLKAGLVTNRQLKRATERLEQALNLPYIERYPNRHRCFPGS